MNKSVNEAFEIAVIHLHDSDDDIHLTSELRSSLFEIAYADKKTITDGIVKKYRPELLEPTPHMSDCDNIGSRSMPLTEKNAPVTHTGNKRKNNGGTALQPHPKHKMTGTEMKNNGQA